MYKNFKTVLFYVGYSILAILAILFFILKSIIHGIIKILKRVNRKSKDILDFVDMELEANAMFSFPNFYIGSYMENPIYQLYKTKKQKKKDKKDKMSLIMQTNIINLNKKASENLSTFNNLDDKVDKVNTTVELRQV